MPTVFTGSSNMVWNAGKGLGQINAEKESYTRGVEQARLDMQKKQIADTQRMRQLARIDADEKETRRQLEWDAIAKRSQAAVEESKRRFGIERTELTAGQQAVEDRFKSAAQLKADRQKSNDDMIKGMLQGQAVQPAATQPTVTQPAQTEEEKWTAGVESWTQKQARLKFKEQYPNATMETTQATQEPIAQAEPTPVQKSLQDQYIEGVQKQIITIDAEYKKKLRVKAVSDVYNPKASASQNEMRIKSKYNELLKTAKEKNTEANLRLISAKSKVEEASKQKKLTPVQQLYQANKILEWGDESVKNHPYTVKQIKWAKDLITKHTGGAGTEQSGTQETRNKALQTLQSNNYPITEANIQMIMKQLQGNI